MKTKIISWVFFFIVFLTAIIALPFLPEEIACQWDSHGNVTNIISKWGVFIPAVISIFFLLRGRFLPESNPDFKKTSDFLHLTIMAILLFFEIYMILYNTGTKIVLETKYLNIILGLFLILTGNVLPKIPQNYFTGVKTVWGYKNDEIWTKTQRLSSKLWVALGFIMLFSIFLPWDIHSGLNIVIILIIVITPYIYGFFLQSKIDNDLRGE